MIGEMLQVDNLNANQMQLIDLLCQINESDEIVSNTAYYANNNRVDEFKDFVVENADEILSRFNACKTLNKNCGISKLVLLNTKELDEIKEYSRIIVNFKYVNGIPKFCYVRMAYNFENKEGNIVKSVFNWNAENADARTFGFDEIESHDKKSDFFIKIMFD